MSACVDYQGCDKFDKEKICAMPFASKLWLVASLKHRTFIKWGPTGDSILLHLSDLDAYLRSLQSMFNAKDCNEFLLNLTDHGFTLVRQNLVSFIEFRHKFFARDRLEYLCMIVNESPNSEPDKKTKERRKFDVGFRMSRDICIMKHGYWTKLQFYQAKTKIAIEYNAAKHALKTALQKRTIMGIPIPAQIFKQPAESVLDIRRDEHFFGYHGEVEPESLDQFFGDRKPILQPIEQAPPEYEPLPPNVFNLDFLNPIPIEEEQNKLQQTSPNTVKYEDLLPDDYDARSMHSDMMDYKQRNESDDDIFEDDDEYIEPIEEPEPTEQTLPEQDDFFNTDWASVSELDQETTNKQLLDSLPDLNSFFEEEECLQNQTGLPFSTQSRFFSDR